MPHDKWRKSQAPIGAVCQYGVLGFCRTVWPLTCLAGIQ